MAEEEEEEPNLPLPPRPPPLPGNAAARPLRPRMAQPQPAEGPAPRAGTWVSATLPRRFLQLPSYRGYGQPEPHPLYRTTNQEYGRRAPTVYEVPVSYHVTSHAFSDSLAQRGMYRNDGLNTSLEKSRVTGPANFITPRDTLDFHPSYKVGGPSHC